MPGCRPAGSSTITWPAATEVADEAQLRSTGGGRLRALSRLLGCAAGHRRPLPDADGLDGPTPELLLDDGALGRLLVRPDCPGRLPVLLAGRRGHRRCPAECVGLLPGVPDDVPFPDEADGAGVPVRRLDAGAASGFRRRRGDGLVASRPGGTTGGPGCCRGLCRLPRVALLSDRLHREPGDPPAVRLPLGYQQGEVAGHGWAGVADRAHQGVGAAAGGGGVGGGVRALAVLGSCGAAGLLWPVIAGVVVGTPMAYTDSMGAWSLGPGYGLMGPWLQYAEQPANAVKLVLAVVLIVGMTVGPWAARLGVVLRTWTLAYAGYVLLLDSPSTSLFRHLLPFFPLTVVAVGGGVGGIGPPA